MMFTKWVRFLFAACLPLYFGRDFTGGDSKQDNTANDNRVVNDVSGGGIQSQGSVSILTTDHGAVQAATTATTGALRLASESLTTGADTFARSLNFARANTADTFDAVRGVLSDSRANTSQVFGTVSNLLGFARDTLSTNNMTNRLATTAVQEAFTTAKDSADGNRTLILTGYILVGVVAVTMFYRRKAA